MSDPIIYAAVVDRVTLLPHPSATAEFYMRHSEAKSMVEVLRTKSNPSSATYVSPPPEFVKPDFAATIADSLITALLLARTIIGNDGDVAPSSKFAKVIRISILSQIDE
ncbi:MAG: hypothetical protein ACRED6_08230 [Stellaceae bacterium]